MSFRKVSISMVAISSLFSTGQAIAETNIDSFSQSNVNPMAQINSVFQLRDVAPSDWAFDALRNLVEKYNCIVGYPNGTFRGDRPLSRYEFAAGLNACMQQIERLITGGEDVDAADITRLRSLITEFETELASLGARVDDIEGKVEFLEDHQFSTTTKLSGQVFMNLTGATAGDPVRVETTNASSPLNLRPAGRGVNGEPVTADVEDPNVTLSFLTWLNFNTSFTGKDNLAVQLQAGSGTSPANAFASAGLFNTFGTPFTDQTGAGSSGDVVIRELFYQFPVSDSVQVAIGPRINWYRHFDNNRYTFFIKGASSFNSIGSTLTNPFDRGSGAVVMWKISDKFKFHVGYLGESTEFLPSTLFNSASNPSQGLFGGTNTLTGELTYSPSKDINLRFLYNRVNTQPIFGRIGGAIGEPIGGLADDGLGGAIDASTSDVFSFNFDWSITPKFGIFGRYSYGSTKINPLTPGVDGGDVDVQAVQAGLAFPDLGKKGALLTVSYVMPYDYTSGENFLVSGAGDGGTQHDLEATYFYPVTKNIALVPAFYTIFNANNFSDNPNIYVGNLRMQINF